ncbi:MAG: hypothetical protein AAGA94_01705 [Pseudomonadota bacterium]
MSDRIVIPALFTVEAAQINWCQVFSDRLDDFLEILVELFPEFADQIYGNENLQNLDELLCEILRQIGYPVNAAHLRWVTAPSVGLPSRAFRVWRRRSLPFEGEEALDPDTFTVATTIGGPQVLSFNRTLAMVRMTVTMPGAGGLIFGCSGGPTFEHWTAAKAVAGGAHVVKIGAPNLTGIVLPPGATLHSIFGVTQSDAANSQDWELVEVVGLPVEPAEWVGVGEHDQEQGLLSEGLVAPKDAALARYHRGRALLGWPAFLAPGILAPIWRQPVGPQLIQEMEEQILSQVREVAEFAPNRMANQRRTITVPPPENATGAVATTEPSEADYSPLELMLTGISTDPNLSLILGYGTAIAQEDISQGTGALDMLEGVDDYDYMVTADWDQGLNGRGDELTLAALAIAPGPALAGAQPTGVAAVPSQPMAPIEPDGDWRRSVRFLWQRVPRSGFYRIASYAAAKVRFQPGEQAELMNELRDSGGIRPIAASLPPSDAADGQPSPSGPLPGEKTHLSAIDRVVNIPPPALPVNNGSIIMGYAACTQTIFGLWGNWAGSATTLHEPNPNRVPILRAELAPQVVSAGPAPATLVVEFGWDWSVRRPASVIIGGRLYAAQYRSDPPPSDLPTLQLPRSLGGVDPAIEVTFAGDTPSGPPGSNVEGLTADGESFATFGPAQGDEIRRYRITVPGFSLNFGTTPHVGLALWARGTELRAPGRIGPWTETPYLIAASDPRPPSIVVEHVDFASLPDARGEAHGRIDWPEVPNVAGYWIYEVSETSLRAALGLPPPGQGASFSDRLAEIRSAYNGNPVRFPFTRKFSELLQVTSLDVTLPRGSRDIHFFMVLAQSRTNTDSDWPESDDAGDQLIPITAPQVARPEPPVLEVRRVLDETVMPPVLRAQITVTPRIGHRASRVLIYRTRVGEAAREIDTMGPPIADLSPFEPGWTFETASDAFASDHIVRAEGFDTPAGSWRKLWYRAEVWSEGDPERALLPGRSAPSPAQQVVIPPSGPPHLGGITAEWPGGALGTVLLRWTSRAPLAETPLGPHLMAIDVKVAGTQGLTEPVLSEALPLAQISEGPALAAAHWWRDGAPAANGTQVYRALIVRESVDQALSIGVRVHDPIGRISEELFTVASGPVDPAPTIIGLSALDLGDGLKGVSWTSTVRLTESAGGVYRVRVRAERAGDGGLVRDPVFTATLPNDARDGRFAQPIATRSRLGAPGMRSPLRDGPGGLRPPGDGSLLITRDVPKIDVRANPPGRAPETGLRLWRLSPFGKGVGFGAATAANVSRFVVRVTAPDGRFVERSVEV